MKIDTYCDLPDPFHREVFGETIQLVNGAQSYFFMDTPNLAAPLPNDTVEVLDPAQCLTALDQHLMEDHRILCVTSRPFSDGSFCHRHRRATIFSIAEWEGVYRTPSLKSYMSFVSAAALLPFAANLREEVAESQLHADLTGCVRDRWQPKESIKLGMLGAMVCDGCRGTFRTYGVPEDKLHAVCKILQFVRAEAIGRPVPMEWNTAFVVMKYDDENNRAFDNAIQPALESLGIRAERSDRIPAGGSLLAHLRERIEHCQYLVAKMDVDSHNVFFEIGLAMGIDNDKDVLLIMDDTFIPPTDLKGWRSLTYPRDDCEFLRSAISKYFSTKYHLRERSRAEA